MKKLWFVLLLLFSASFVWATEVPVNNNNLSNDLLSFTRIDHTFISEGKKCGAWLYLPAGVSKPPVVVMAHGFGGQRWMRLPAYAERFAQRGMAVFVFDYRGFNDSEGEPRNYINPSLVMGQRAREVAREFEVTGQLRLFRQLVEKVAES